MDNNNQIPSFEIPKSAEQAPLYKGGKEVDPQLDAEGTREILPSPFVGGSIQPTSGQGPVSLPPAEAVSSLPSSALGATTDDSHVIAEDNDVIEKEWVDRAKKIISLTSNDPFVEAKEMSKLKATYMRKRFNKDIPLADEKSS